MAASVIQELEEGSWLEGIHNSSVSAIGDNQPAPTVSLPTLTADQYQQLLTLLNKQIEASNAGSNWLFGRH